MAEEVGAEGRVVDGGESGWDGEVESALELREVVWLGFGGGRRRFGGFRIAGGS